MLGDQATLDAEGYTRQEAAQRLAADLAFYGCTTGVDTWLTETRAALRQSAGAELMPGALHLPCTRCPSCGFAAQPGSMSYLIKTGGSIDWSAAVHASCGICGREHVLTRDQVLALDAEHTCPRPGCGAVTPCPASAARVRCRRCGVYGFGPGAASDAARAELELQERLHAFELRQAVLRARRAQRAEGGTW